jgi:translin
MEEISEELRMMDVPDAVVPLRRKQDIARGIMDKTRSDMLGATVRRS